MIIKTYTGAFVRELPQDDSDPTPVTYTISNKPPPPIVPSYIVKVPLGVAQNDPIVESSPRSDYGALIFTYIQGNKTIPGSNRRSFEPGEIIEFDDDVPTSSTLVNTAPVVVQHNTNTLDLTDLGLSDAEISEIEAQSSSRIAEIKQQITALQASANDTRILIRENQKAINETRKAIKAVGVAYVVTSTNSNAIYDKLNANLVQLESVRSDLNTLLTTITTELRTAQDDLVRVSQLVK